MEALSKNSPRPSPDPSENSSTGPRSTRRPALRPPWVSIVMPMRDAERFVAKALESIIEQDYPHIEIIIVNDGSTDRSVQRVRSYLRAARVPEEGRRVVIVEGPQRGIAAAFNCGLALAKGKVLMRCDADDRFVRGRIRRQVEFLQEHPEVSAVCQPYIAVDRRGRFIATLATDQAEGDVTQSLFEAKPLTHLCTFAMRTDLVKKIRGCREAFVTAEDIDLQLRLAQEGPICFLRGSAYEYRIHGASITHQQVDAQRLFYENLARDCQKQRALGQVDMVERGAIPSLPPGIGTTRKASEQLQGYLTGKAWALRKQGDMLGALSFGARAVAMKPNSWSTWRSSLALLKPGKGRPGARSSVLGRMTAQRFPHAAE